MKYRLVMDVTFETGKPVALMEVKGTVGQVLEALDGIDNPLGHLDDESDATSKAVFSITQVEG